MAALDLSVRAPLAPGRPVTERESLAWGMVVSTCVHVAIALALALVVGVPEIASRGEDGLEGGGGATFEVTMEGAPEAELHPAIDVPEPTPSSAPVAQAHPSRPPPPTTTSNPSATASATPSTTTSASATPSASATTNSASIAAAGTGDDTTDPGRLRGRDDARIRALLEGSVGGTLGGSSLGDVALLEAASRCPDPVAGTWTAHRYSPEFRDWARFTLNITRDGDHLTGTIRTRMWRGLPSDSHPGPCGPGGWDYTVEMRAHGAVHGESFDFGATEHHIAHVECASPTFGYNPDHFSGTFDADRDLLRTLNNDGGRDVDAAYTFRRSSCQP